MLKKKQMEKIRSKQVIFTVSEESGECDFDKNRKIMWFLVTKDNGQRRSVQNLVKKHVCFNGDQGERKQTLDDVVKTRIDLNTKPFTRDEIYDR